MQPRYIKNKILVKFQYDTEQNIPPIIPFHA